MFLIACFVVFGFMFALGPGELRPVQHRALGVAYAFLVGALAYFAVGSTKRVAESDWSPYAKVGVCLIVAFMAAALVFGLWEFGLSPVRRLSDG